MFNNGSRFAKLEKWHPQRPQTWNLTHIQGGLALSVAVETPARVVGDAAEAAGDAHDLLLRPEPQVGQEGLCHPHRTEGVDGESALDVIDILRAGERARCSARAHPVNPGTGVADSRRTAS